MLRWLSCDRHLFQDDCRLIRVEETGNCLTPSSVANHLNNSLNDENLKTATFGAQFKNVQIQLRVTTGKFLWNMVIILEMLQKKKQVECGLVVEAYAYFKHRCGGAFWTQTEYAYSSNETIKQAHSPSAIKWKPVGILMNRSYPLKIKKNKNNKFKELKFLTIGKK